MLKDADFNYFPAVYVVVYGYTDMRYGINSLAAIINVSTRLIFLSQIPCSCFVADSQLKSKISYGKEMDFCSYISVWTVVTSPGLEKVMNYAFFVLNSSNGKRGAVHSLRPLLWLIL